MKIKIAIADDHPLVINGLRHVLANCADMEVIASFNDGNSLLQGLIIRQPDVLLLDIHMPGRTGDELADIINKQYPDIRMLALTNLDNPYYIRTMLTNGVLGYILKTTREEILLDAIRTVYHRASYLEPALKNKLNPDVLLASNNNLNVPVLSRREKEVLQHIAANLTSQQIADKLFISKRTVDNHRMSLLMKLGTKNVAAMVKKSLQLGLIK